MTPRILVLVHFQANVLSVSWRNFSRKTRNAFEIDDDCNTESKIVATKKNSVVQVEFDFPVDSKADKR